MPVIADISVNDKFCNYKVSFFVIFCMTAILDLPLNKMIAPPFLLDNPAAGVHSGEHVIFLFKSYYPLGFIGVCVPMLRIAVIVYPDTYWKSWNF